jgi:hypothetical protein
MDNRQFRRMAFNATVLIKHEEMSFVGKVENLSLRGLFVKTDQKIPLNETVNITLSFIGNSANVSLSMEGKVVRVTDDGIGLNFKKISIESLEQSMNECSKCTDDSCRLMEAAI